jgi:hypothetical protein
MNIEPIHHEGFTQIVPSEWDINGLHLKLRNLNAKGIRYNVRNFPDHINMLVNHLNLPVQVGKIVTGNFPGQYNGTCYQSNNNQRYLTRQFVITPAKPPVRRWGFTTMESFTESFKKKPKPLPKPVIKPLPRPIAKIVAKIAPKKATPKKAPPKKITPKRVPAKPLSKPLSKYIKNVSKQLVRIKSPKDAKRFLNNRVNEIKKSKLVPIKNLNKKAAAPLKPPPKRIQNPPPRYRVVNPIPKPTPVPFNPYLTNQYKYNLNNNYENCKRHANNNNLNTFGLQNGTECWAGNTNNKMETIESIPRSLIPISKNLCNRGSGFDNGTGGVSSMNVFKKPSSELKTIVNYEEIIKQFVNSGYKNDSDVIRANNLNLNGFTTMEGFVEGATAAPKQIFVSNSNKITVLNNKGKLEDILTNKTIDAIVEKGYNVEVKNLNKFIKKFSYTGKKIDDIKSYIETNIKFGITHESLFLPMIRKISQVSPNQNQFQDIGQMILNLKTFGVKDVTGIVDRKNGVFEDGWFIRTVKSAGLRNIRIQLLPSTIPGHNVDSILDRMSKINGSIKTLGLVTNGGYAFEHFFRVFDQVYKINGSRFFIDIYNIYSDPSMQLFNYSPTEPGVDALTDLLSKINAFSTTGLVNAFKNVKVFLGPNGLNMTFSEYILFYDALKARITYNCSIIELWNRFKVYYTTVAFPSTVTSPPQVKPSNLIDMIDRIINRSRNSKYFSNGNFYQYLQVLIDNKYQLSNVLEDVGLGKEYKQFLETTKQGFTTITPQSNKTSEFDIFQYFTDGFNSFFGMTPVNKEVEGMNPTPKAVITEADNVILKRFGITDYNEQLKSVKSILFKYHIHEINPKNTRWRNMINLIDNLTKVQITLDKLPQFVQLMVQFRAVRIIQWYDVLEKLTFLKITGYTNIREFIILISNFGVMYANNFNRFINIMVEFKADLSNSLVSMVTFVSDMIYIRYRYNTNANNVDNIIRYFILCGYTLTTYSSSNNNMVYSSALCSKNPNTLPTPGLPRNIVISFYEYKSPAFQNDLFDIQNLSFVKDMSFCDIIDSMQQAYMIASPNVTSYNGATQNFIPNVTKLIAFLYKSEFDQIIQKPGSYQNYNKRFRLIKDLANGVDSYKQSLKDKAEFRDDYNLYTSLAKTLNAYPILCFQYLSNFIRTNCSKPNCEVSKYVDVNGSFSKARNDGKPTNYRQSNPIL